MFPWHKFPLPLALLQLIQFRNSLRENNLHDTSQIADSEKLPTPQPSSDGRHLVSRTADGSFNDLSQPEMGMAGTRFGRNVPLAEANVDERKLLEPNPRLVSRVLLKRDTFIPATILNLHAAAWIQFQTHDWFTHGENQPADQPDSHFSVPPVHANLDEAEGQPLEVAKTLKDPSRSDDNTRAATFINDVTHWWDASQLYGSDEETVQSLRSHQSGKMLIGEDGLLPLDSSTGIDHVGFPGSAGGWWIGLSLLHTLFIKEHNTICDRLQQLYPDWDDSQLFDKARLINAALLAKIHTVEWTPAILPNPATQIAMNANWWGLLGKEVKEITGSIGDSEILSGIVGSQTDHHAAPYYLTEEFVSVYRMHPLIPDEMNFYSHRSGEHLAIKPFPEVFGKRARGAVQSLGVEDSFYSFGIQHPGAITLHNYPNFLRALMKDGSTKPFDLAAVDILRDRERGIPRYNRFREVVGRGRVHTFDSLTSNRQWAKELREVYNNDIDSVDLMVGLFAEDLPEGFGFSDTAFRVFILMASRRLKSDRFFTTDYRAEIYTQLGLDWIDNNSFLTVLRRHYPALSPALYGLENGFQPWKNLTSMV
ncbi:MAG: peroxidase family protein [Cyanobacteria bacterium P01_C01_bin.69]